jgi:hypothetical protein
MPAGQILEFAFTIHKGPLTYGSVVFVPDDHFISLSANGQDVPLDTVDPQRLDDFHDGFRFGIGAYLRSGDNSIVARVLNRGGPGGLDVRSDMHDWRSIAEALAAMAAFLLLVAMALRRFKVKWPIVVVFLAGVAVRLAYLSVTPFTVRGHDFDHHIEYIEYIVAHGSLPGPYDGWSFYQPPLYYVLAAALWKTLTVVGITSRETVLCALQLQSMLYELGFLGFSICTASRWIDRLPDAGFGRMLSSRSGLHALAAALICLWPSSVMHSVRLGNDDLLYLCFGAGVYFASRWWVTGRDRNLNAAAACGALGMLTKTNSLLIFVLLGVLLVVRFVLDNERKIGTYLRRAWPTAALCLLSAGAVLGRAAIDTASGKRSNLLVGNARSLNSDLAIGNHAANYLWFDTKIFVTQPFTSPWDDAKGRQFFWNYALKSSLFGEFGFDHVWLSNLAVIVSVLFLIVFACFVSGILLRRGVDWLQDLPAVVLSITLVASLAALRMSIPRACSGDFRYILPIVTPFTYLYIRSLTLFRERGLTTLARGALCLGWSFTAFSALFFIVLAIVG